MKADHVNASLARDLQLMPRVFLSSKGYFRARILRIDEAADRIISLISPGLPFHF